MHRISWALPALAALLCACSSTAPSAGQAYGQRPSSTSASQRSEPAAPRASAAVSATPSAGRGAETAPGSGAASPPLLPSAARGGPARFPPTAAGILHGKVVVVDPGHNGGNFAAASVINRLIWNGRERETCDTTGTQTDTGYTEALFNWNVARYLTADLRAEGATVVLTRTSNTGVGPCVTERAAVGNAVHANAAVSIHADGGPPDGRGFAILEPVADGINDAVIRPSAILGADLRTAFAAGTGEPVSNYDGADGIQPRDDLAGTNLSTVPKVFIECANMRNAGDAALVTSARWQAMAARAVAAGLSAFLTGAG
jgi:N-acetylmuramoyl-L-alanine amidase